jgi:sterol desaturase/sphingolipid hydroxylase (fatty acid hydroxylase superfamily)
MELAMQEAARRGAARSLVRWGLYPFSWAVTLCGFWLIINTAIDPRQVWMINGGFLAALYLLIEWQFPYERRWAMSFRSFLADLRFLIVNGAFMAAVTAALGYLTITISGDLSGPARDWPLAWQVVSSLLIFEAINYALHRAMHELRGPLGRFLWLSHAAHHLPPRLYLIMHAVFHPINALFVQVLAIVLPIWLMGYDQKAVTMFLMINGMHGLISHFNVDARMGWLNYIFVGPETHRYHHSADIREARNYGNTLTVYDLLFGTFVYRSGIPPAELGVDKRAGLPAYEHTLAVLALPFRASPR